MGVLKWIKLSVIWAVHIAWKLLTVISTPIFKYIFEPMKNDFVVPPAGNELIMKPAIVLATMIRNKQVSVPNSAHITVCSGWMSQI